MLASHFLHVAFSYWFDSFKLEIFERKDVVKKPLNILILFVFVSALSSFADAGVTQEECAKDHDCVKFYSELGNKNFEILREIRDFYVKKTPFGSLAEAFREGGIKAVFSLLDTHSRYVTSAEKALEEESEKPFGGVGMRVGEKDKKIIVSSLIKNGPAMRSGKIKKGDILLAVGDKSVIGASSDIVAGWIRGEIGKEIALKFMREDAEPAEYTVILKRELIDLSALSSQVFGDAGYIFLPSFEENASLEIYLMIKQFPKNVNSYVLDLRGNPGGLFFEANCVSSLFLEATQLIEKIVGRQYDQSYYAGECIVFKEQIKFPVVVLVDEFSASASEIVAAAFQDNGRAVIIGMPTFGKALVQSRYGYSQDLDPYWFSVLLGDYFTLTTELIYRPNGKTLQGKGVIPDILISNGGGDDIKKNMLERPFSERKLKGHLRGEEEDIFTQAEQAKLDLLKEDRQLHIALEVLKIMSAKEKE